MSKLFLVENNHQRLSYIKESGDRDGRNYLGKLAGVGADWKKPTRNGRRYPKELWVNVLKSADFNEMMETRTCFGENDHPSDASGRIETSIKEISIVLTRAELRESEGIVYCEFDILDTPQGRLLKELCDYGSKIGVSTRGLGDEVERGGEVLIDPDTYVFYGWDAVIMPAVITARPAVVESAKRSLTESFAKEIEQAKSAPELESIKRVVEATNMPELDSIKESIDNKLKVYDGEDISTKLTEDLGNLAVENEKLKTENEELKSQIASKDISAGLMIDRLKVQSESRHTDKEKLTEMDTKLNEYEDSLYDGAMQISAMSKDSQSKLEKRDTEIRNLKRENFKLSHEVSSVKTELTEQKSEVAMLTGENKRLTSKVESLSRTVKETRTAKADVDSRLTESGKKTIKLSEEKEAAVKESQTSAQKVKSLTEKLTKTVQEYLHVKCAQYGLDEQVVLYNMPKTYTVEDINSTVETLADRKRRLSKLPVEYRIQSLKLSESEESEADKNSISMIRGAAGLTTG